jgi:hypothetical protein
MQSTRERVMAALADDDLTSAQVAELLGLHRNTADYHLRRARKEKRAHVCGWDRHEGTQGDWGAIYRCGEGQDVPPPKTIKKIMARVYGRRYYRANRALIRARSAAKRGKLGHYVQLIA